jgi:hypothetical protein
MIKPARLLRVLTIAASAALLLLEGPTPARAQASEARKAYDLPADDADRALRRFSEQSGIQVIFPSETVRNVRANGVQGNLTAREALDQMFKGTGLIAVQDAKTGALTVRRDLAKDAPKNAPGPVADSSAAPGPIVKMDGMEVLGSRIRRTETDGPTPVATYGVDAIRATGAMNLADFMRTVPQTYNGVGAGRNSTPDDLNISAGQRTENLIPMPRCRRDRRVSASADWVPARRSCSSMAAASRSRASATAAQTPARASSISTPSRSGSSNGSRSSPTAPPRSTAAMRSPASSTSC